MPLREREYMGDREPDGPPFIYDSVQGRYMRQDEYRAIQQQRGQATAVMATRRNTTWVLIVALVVVLVAVSAIVMAMAFGRVVL